MPRLQVVQFVDHAAHPAFNRPAKPGAKNSVCNDTALRQYREFCYGMNIVQAFGVCLLKGLPVSRMVRRRSVTMMQYTCGGLVAAIPQQAGDGQSVAAVIAHTTENIKRVGAVKMPHQPLGTGARSSFHQLQTADRFMPDGISICVTYLCGRKYFHNIM